MNHLFPALRRSALVTLTLLLAVALVACGNGDDGGPGDDNSAGGTIAVTNGVALVTADNMEFDANTIQAPAGEDFTIAFTNNENVPHNLSVYTEEGGELIAQGDIINEGDVDEVEVPALEAGEYFFVCDVHPVEMTGTIVVEG